MDRAEIAMHIAVALLSRANLATGSLEYYAKATPEFAQVAANAYKTVYDTVLQSDREQVERSRK